MLSRFFLAVRKFACDCTSGFILFFKSTFVREQKKYISNKKTGEKRKENVEDKRRERERVNKQR